MLSGIPILIHPVEYIYVKDKDRAEAVALALAEYDAHEKAKEAVQ